MKKQVVFPRYRKELLNMLEVDQQQIIEYARNNALMSKHEKDAGWNSLLENYHKRAAEMMQIIDVIKSPTVSNIGFDGSQAVSILALHSYIDVMQSVLMLFESEFAQNPNDIYYQAIPSLKDRLLIINGKKQLFGTQWYQSSNGKTYLFPIEDFTQMNELRAEYGLEPASRPKNVATGERPLGEGLAISNEQKTPTQAELAEYSLHHIRSKK